MITEDYVSFETAKLLKDKGFDEHCFCINYPLPEGGHHSIILPNLLNNSMIQFIDEYKFCRYKEDFITIPTLQMAMKWLRKVHNLHIWVEPNHDKEGLYNAHVKVGWWSNNWAGIGYNTHEKATEAAIKYCLENLI